MNIPEIEKKTNEGGLRLDGFCRSVDGEHPLITVVTVVYHGVGFLEETIKSVIGQSYRNVEYIIIDGGSTDGTVDIIRKYHGFIDYWISESDNGIYDAMNKGIQLSTGDWISFMNAGDKFFHPDVLDKIFIGAIDYSTYDVIYGDHMVKYPDKFKIVKAGKVENLWKGSQFCHQSSFVRLSHHKSNKFNTNLKIAADFDFFYKSFQTGSKMLYRPLTISLVSSGGVSDIKRFESIIERFRCLDKRLYKLYYYSFILFLESLKIVVKSFVKSRFR